MGKIVLEIDEKEGILFDLFKNCKNEEEMKDVLYDFIDTLSYYKGDIDEELGYLSPERWKNECLEGETKERLLTTKEKLKDKVIEELTSLNVEDVECGVHPDHDMGRWFIKESCDIGYAILYANYIKKIEEML